MRSVSSSGPIRKPAERRHGVDRGGVGETLLEHPLPLAVEGAGDPVDDEPRRGRAMDRGLAPGRHEVGGEVDVGLGARGAVDDLDQPHDRCGVEEVQPDHPLRVVDRLGDGVDVEARRVGRQQRRGRLQPAQLGEHRLLDLEVLGGGLDDELALRQVGRGRRRRAGGRPRPGPRRWSAGPWRRGRPGADRAPSAAAAARSAPASWR